MFKYFPVKFSLVEQKTSRRPGLSGPDPSSDSWNPLPQWRRRRSSWWRWGHTVPHNSSLARWELPLADSLLRHSESGGVCTWQETRSLLRHYRVQSSFIGIKMSPLKRILHKAPQIPAHVGRLKCSTIKHYPKLVVVSTLWRSLGFIKSKTLSMTFLVLPVDRVQKVVCQTTLQTWNNKSVNTEEMWLDEVDTWLGDSGHPAGYLNQEKRIESFHNWQFYHLKRSVPSYNLSMCINCLYIALKGHVWSLMFFLCLIKW